MFVKPRLPADLKFAVGKSAAGIPGLTRVREIVVIVFRASFSNRNCAALIARSTLTNELLSRNWNESR